VARIPNAVLAGADELARRDRVMQRALHDYGPPDLRRGRPRRTHFAELARMICYQQLAGNAAAAIHGRFAALYDGAPTAAAVLATPVETLRGVGLSGAKAASITDLAQKVEDGVVELDRIARMPDDEVVRELTLVRGIGEWTAHMFLMFQCGRLDVWPTGDLGVRAGFGRLYGVDPPPTPKVLLAAGEPFRPWRSLVAWWCWRAVDTTVPA
jgi:3-methyladenine DNA glycosylase/8-oxoguanine DNA glycosylase